MKEEFEEHPDKEKYRADYENQLYDYLAELIRSADDWTNREKRNIQAANQVIQEAGPNDVARVEIKELNNQAQKLIEEAENLAEQGAITLSKDKLRLADDLKDKATHWEEKAKSLKPEDVCEICGSRMESGNSDKARLQKGFRHQDGKIHLGYVKIREWYEEVKKKHESRVAAGSFHRDSAGDKRRERDGESDRDRRRRSRSGRRGDQSKDRDGDSKASVGLAATSKYSHKDDGERRDRRDGDRLDRRGDYDRRDDRDRGYDRGGDRGGHSRDSGDRHHGRDGRRDDRDYRDRRK